MLTPAEAERLIAERLEVFPVEDVALDRCAGRVLRADLFAERDSPPFDRVMMDGVALRSDVVARGRRRFPVEATQAAGDPAVTLDDGGHCIEVMTGAVLPIACDAVVPVERLTVVDDMVELEAGLVVEAGQHIHPRGADAAQGDLLLAAGHRLSAPEVAIAASSGAATVPVGRQPRIVVISTGNELVDPGAPILPHQIRRSNVYAVVGALRQHGFEHVATDHVLDDEGELHRRLGAHLDASDVLILSGGVSMGRFDLVPAALAALGVDVAFHKVAQRPGKPMWFGTSASGTAVFALPGNPVSTLVCLARYVVPALFAAMGQAARPPEPIALAEPFPAHPDLTLLVAVRVVPDAAGRPAAVPAPTNGSGDLTSLGGTDGFVELPPGSGPPPAGHVAALYRWS